MKSAKIWPHFWPHFLPKNKKRSTAMPDFSVHSVLQSGAGGRTWTGTKLPSRDFKSLASAYSATSAYIGGTTRNRTVDEGFADPSLTAWLWCHNSFPLCWIPFLKKMERKTRFELATFTLARWRSTTEPLPHFLHITIFKLFKKV